MSHRSRKLLHRTQRLGVWLAICLGIVALTPTAHADPHALFYTVVGQQQLFFNVLAALDQADYVEPIEERARLLEKRKTVGFGPEEDERVTETKSELASILTRGITLEGNDLWTAYLTHQFALERARRNNTDEVLRIFCERGLGLKECEGDDDSVKYEEDQKEAFIVNPALRNIETYTSGVLGILGSSYTGYDQAKRQQLETDHSNRPYPFDSFLAELRDQASRNPTLARGSTSRTAQAATNEPTLAERAVERVASAAASVYRPTNVNPATFNDLDINEDGSVELALLSDENSKMLDESGGAYIDRYIASVGNLLKLPGAMISTAGKGEGAVAAVHEAEEEGGALADTVAVPQPQSDTGGAVAGITSNANAAFPNPTPVLGGRQVRIKVPAHAKLAAADVALGTLGSAEENLKYAPPKAESIVEGAKPLVEAGSAPTAPAPGAGPAVQGLSTSDSLDSRPGRVLHSTAVIDSTATSLHTNKTPLAPGTNPVGIHHEQGAVHLLKAIGYQADRGGCNCHDYSRTVPNSFGQNILRKINGH